MAQDALAALSLDRLMVVPAGQQPLKTTQHADAGHRLAMVQRCFDGVPKVVVDPLEIERGGLSFMVETVETFRQRWPSAELYLLVGEDVVATMPRWRHPERLLSMVHVVVWQRATADATTSASPSQHDTPDIPVQRLALRRVDVSSTEVRERVRAGRSIRGFVTDGVADYIASTGLYLREPIAADVSVRA